MKSYSFIFALLLSFALQACGHANTEDALRQAEIDIESGEVLRAVQSCKLLADSVSSSLSSTQMCRVAIIYAKASELADNLDYMAAATKCFDRAVSLDSSADSLANYIESLDLETQGRIRDIRELSHALNSPYDYAQIDSDDAEEAYVEQMDGESHEQ